MALHKIEAGLYVLYTNHGNVKIERCEQIAANAHCRWVVTFPDGKPDYYSPTLHDARILAHDWQNRAHKELTADQRKAFRHYIHKHGERWTEHIVFDFMREGYPGINPTLWHLMNQIRNSFTMGRLLVLGQEIVTRDLGQPTTGGNR